MLSKSLDYGSEASPLRIALSMSRCETDAASRRLPFVRSFVCCVRDTWSVTKGENTQGAYARTQWNREGQRGRAAYAAGTRLWPASNPASCSARCSDGECVVGGGCICLDPWDVRHQEDPHAPWRGSSAVAEKRACELGAAAAILSPPGGERAGS